jgi:tetratricopeptide (TPR) repeat protein
VTVLTPLVLVLLLFQAAPAAPIDHAAIVRSHYAAAAYEEALAHVARIEPERITAALEQYRALCLLALGRQQEGESAFERLVRLDPLYVIAEGDLSPRLYAVFRDIRRRTLPDAARELYYRGKTAFDEGRYDVTLTEMRKLMRVLSDPDAVSDAATFADIRQLADGFLRLAQAEIDAAARTAAAAEAAAAAPPAPPPAPEQVPEPAAASDALRVTRIIVYSRADKEVVPPVERNRFMPPWNPPAAMAKFLQYQGELEVIVDEAGRVGEARMLRPTIPSYDLALTDATRGWRFEPARLDDEPVKYRLTFQVVLTPSR